MIVAHNRGLVQQQRQTLVPSQILKAKRIQIHAVLMDAILDLESQLPHSLAEALLNAAINAKLKNLANLTKITPALIGVIFLIPY
jgi:hypothetical protein